jgi:cobalt-zinc-cadmium resistance protein CzcA
MLNHIIGFSIRNKLIIALGVLGLVIYGSYQFTKLPIDAVPDITNNQVQVITVSPSLGAPDVERLITFPIEQANSNIPGLVEIRSFSRFGLSLVTIVFDDETDIYWARQQVSERLVNVKDMIPPGAGIPSLGPVTTGLGEIYQYVVRPKKGYEDKFDVMQLRTIQDWIVRRQLLGIKGVADVSSFGGKLKQYEIAVDAAKLKSFGISMDDVFNALEKNNQNTGGAYIEKGPTVLYIRSEGLVENMDDIRSMVVKETQSGSPVFIRDVADIKLGYATRYGAMTFNGETEVAGAVVMMLKGGNSNDVIKSVKERITQIQETLPEGVVIEPFLDRTKMVNNAIGTVEKNLMEGALIVIFVLVLFLGNFRAGLLVASVIPLAMLFAVIMMNTFGVSGNLMSLGALDFGLIVDGAVIIVEAVMHGLHSRKIIGEHVMLDKREMDEGVGHAAGKMMNSAVFGQIIILIVYLPIFTLEGIEGKMFKPMAQTVAFALLGAFILSLTYIPMMCSFVLSRKLGHQPNFSDKLMLKLEDFYHDKLQWALGFPKTIIGGSFAMLLISITVLMNMGGEFIPSLEEGDFAVETRVLVGSNLNVSLDVANKSSQLLKAKFPEVEKVVAKIGSGEIPTDPMPIEAMDLMIILKDKKEWTSAKTFDELSEKMTKELENIPGVTYGFQYPVQMRFNELMTGARQDVVCKIFGENLDSLARYAQTLGAVVSGVEGAKDLYVETVTGMPQIVIKFKRNNLAQYALNIEDVNRVINTAFAGQSSGLVFEGEKRFNLVVRLASEKRSNLEDVRNLLIPTKKGTQVPLYQLADVSIKEGPGQIQREDAKRRIIIGFNVRGRDVESIVTELQEKVKSRLKMAPGYYVTYGGAFENLEAAKARLSLAVPLSLLLILLMLYFTFSSLKHGLLIFSAIPLSAVGGIFALASRGMPFSISAGVGFIALFGVAVLNGIVLIAEFNRLKASGMRDMKAIVLQGTSMRLRPVLMTAFVASLGFLPMAISDGAGAEVQRPLATVVIGGLLLATLLTLFVLPVLYIIFEHIQTRREKRKAMMGLLVLMLFSTSGFAQNRISLEAALDSAVQNNMQLRNASLQKEYKEQIAKASWNIPLTNMNGESGQINSSYKDNRIGLNQAFEFPMVYVRRKQAANAEVKAEMWNLKWKELDLKIQVSKTYARLLNMESKVKLLEQMDDLYNDFLSKAETRLNKGESNILEVSSARMQSIRIKRQLNMAIHDKNAELIYFQYIINTQGFYQPIPQKNTYVLKGSLDSTHLQSHPYVLMYENLVESAKRKKQVAASRFLPEFNFGVQSQSIQGMGADNINYGLSTRFTSIQAGIGIPLFFGASRANLKAAGVELEISVLQYKMAQREMENKKFILWSNYKNCLSSYQLYQNRSVAESELTIKTASQLFQSGEINFLDYTQLINQAAAIQSDYADALFQVNEAITELNYFLP